MHPGGPRVYTIANDRGSGNQLGLLFVAPRQGLSGQHTASCRLLFYLIAGKMLVQMCLDRRGGRLARFGINKGGAWEVPCNTTYRMVNVLAMPAQLVFWWHDASVADSGGGDGGANQPNCAVPAGFIPAVAQNGVLV